MKFGINTIDNINPEGKVILCRLDLNSPLDDNKWPADIYRIERALPSLVELSDKGARLVVMTHQGGDLEYHNYSTTVNHAAIISEKTGIAVKFIDDVCGPAARSAIRELKDGEILLLDNVRFMAEELTLFETKLNLSFEEQTKTVVVRKLAPLADYFMCDAFAAAHRSQPTLVGFPLLLPSVMGRLFEEEMAVLEKVLQSPVRPAVFLFGGTKVQDAFIIMSRVLADGVADKVLTSGLVANIMLIARGIDIGETSYSFLVKNKLLEYIEQSREILETYHDKIMLPLDVATTEQGREEIETDKLPTSGLIVDLGQKTVKKYCSVIEHSKTVFINGPAGVFEKSESAYGTQTLWSTAAKANCFSVVGGGDSVTAVNSLGLLDSFSYVCTGGGAMVRYLSGEKLPVVSALQESARKYSI